MGERGKERWEKKERRKEKKDEVAIVQTEYHSTSVIFRLFIKV